MLAAVLLGFVSGLRTMTSPAIVSWAARTGLLVVTSTPLAFMGAKWTPIIFSILAVGELINDKNPKTPSRKVPPQLIARMLSGGLVGATVGAGFGQLPLGLFLGIVGAILGTYGGALLRTWLTLATKSAIAAALIEDLLAIGIAAVIVLKVIV